MSIFRHCCETRPIFYRVIIFLLLVNGTGILQSRAQGRVIDVADLRFSYIFSNEIAIASADRDFDIANYKELNFSRERFTAMSGVVPGAMIEGQIFLKFSARNSADSARILSFMPGYFCRELSMFKVERDRLSEENIVVQSITKGTGTAQFLLNAGEQADFIARIILLRTNSNRLTPRIIESDFVNHWYRWRKFQENEQDISTYIACGIFLLMIFFSLAVYLQNKNTEFIYYAIFAFCNGILLFIKSYLKLHHTAFNFFYEEYLDLIILCIGFFFYIKFVRNFLNSTIRFASLDRFLSLSSYLLMLLLIVYSAVYFLTEKYIILNVMENYVIKILLFIVGITFITYGFRKKDRLLNYVAAGNFALVFFSLISLLLMLTKIKLIPENPRSLLNKAMWHYEVGLVLELMFFMAGLAYKNRRDIINEVKERERIERENERKEFEKQMAVLHAQQQERNRISADMHDELGSGVTAIRLMSEIVKTKLKDTRLPEIDKISNSANELLNKMNTIIWTMKSSNDTLESLAAYTRAYAIEYFDATNISCHVNIAVIPNIEMSGEKRRNIFLSIKESLNNILKHAQASRVQIDFLVRNNRLFIRISDDGIGIKTESLRRFGNGLSNMRRRMQSIGGKFELSAERGTMITLEVPIDMDNMNFR